MYVCPETKKEYSSDVIFSQKFLLNSQSLTGSEIRIFFRLLLEVGMYRKINIIIK